jgi:PhnB protein
MDVKPIPDGYQRVIPYLTVPDAEAEMEFLKRAFGAAEMFVMRGPGGSIDHAELRIGDSVVMLGQARGEWKPTPCSIYLYDENVDATHARALAAGATSVSPPTDQFYGDRHGAVQDPAGNTWWIATHVEDVSPDEMARRHEAFVKSQSKV